MMLELLLLLQLLLLLLLVVVAELVSWLLELVLPALASQLTGQELRPELGLVLEDGGQAHAVHPLHHAVLRLGSEHVGSHPSVLRLECELSVNSVIFRYRADRVGRQEDGAEDLLLCRV